MSQCVLSSCTYKDQIKLSSVTGGLCRPFSQPSRVWELKLVVAVLSALTFPVIGLRILSRWIVAGCLGLDDWVTVVAAACLAATLGCVVSSTDLGFGLHFWNINPDNAQHILQLFYAIQILYIIMLILAKLSILALFGRLFPDRKFQIFNKLVTVFLICHGLVFFFIVLFQCTPIAATWDQALPQNCIDITTVAMISAILSIVEDFVILGMPIQQLRNLQLGLKKKLASSPSGLGDNVDIIKWTVAESSCALMCGSLPALRPLFMKIPGFFTTLRGSLPTIGMKGPVGKDSGHLSVPKNGFAAGLRSPVPERSPSYLEDSDDLAVVTIHMVQLVDAKMKPLTPSPLEHEPTTHRPHCRDSDSLQSLSLPRAAMSPKPPIALTAPTSVSSPRGESSERYELDMENALSTKTWL
ncbi:hypothetical protein LX36DRAFT_577142 [Colletotrichum falcatum]|nr:hypothetical protein LX36DRAFT_577142 [Colletotrichum falcatum]